MTKVIVIHDVGGNINMDEDAIRFQKKVANAFGVTSNNIIEFVLDGVNLQKNYDVFKRQVMLKLGPDDYVVVASGFGANFAQYVRQKLKRFIPSQIVYINMWMKPFTLKKPILWFNTKVASPSTGAICSFSKADVTELNALGIKLFQQVLGPAVPGHVFLVEGSYDADDKAIAALKQVGFHVEELKMYSNANLGILSAKDKGGSS